MGIRRHITYANVASTLALVLALGGATAYAAGFITSQDIKDGTIRSVDVRNHTLGKKDLSAKAIRALTAKQGTPVTPAANPSGADDPCAADPVPVLQYCGTSSNHWYGGGYGIAPIEVWKDTLGNVHLQGAATDTSGMGGAPTLFRLPAGMRPSRLLAFGVATGPFAGASTTGEVTLVVYHNGKIALYNPSAPSDETLILGEVVFRAKT